MKRGPLFYFALFSAKLCRVALRLCGRQGTNVPGELAIILCPKFLVKMPRPDTVIAITGTNGKTTVSNMVEDVLEHCGYEFICNRNGSNVDTGVASALIAGSSLFGRPQKPLAVFEMDERSANRLMAYVEPDMLLCTNIFRDSYRRNAHTGFIVDILNKYLPDNMHLVLNADDLQCAGLKPQIKDRAYFSVEPMSGEELNPQNIVQDVRVCPECGQELVWDFRRYHHIGRAHCPACGFSSPKADYRLVSVEGGRMRVEIRGKEQDFFLPNRNMINIYNSLSAIALLSEFGLSAEKIAGAMESLSVSKSRYQEEKVGECRVILHLAKGQNPIACSRAFQAAKEHPGKKAVLLFLEDLIEAQHTVENIAWLYDVDFEFLRDSSITQVITAGARHWDVYLRLLMAGADPDRLIHLPDTDQAAGALDCRDLDAVFILYDLHSVELAGRVRAQVEDILKKEGARDEI